MTRRSAEPWRPGDAELVEYEWLTVGGPPPHAPRWLLADIASRPPTPVERDGNPRRSSGDILPPTEEFLERGFGWYTGSRNRDCFRLTWRLYEEKIKHTTGQVVTIRRRNEGEVARILRTCHANTPQDGHAFPWTEVVKTAQSAKRRWQETREEQQGYTDATMPKSWVETNV